ncbi:MltR family transcriptional regulator [Vibrio hippocampi]|uniref:Mannitol operon repressor n=1 Tax=Vibrio hippocampi TaxID=654686 RepID=A0ABN8DK53_9VIBR|nr:MltR family transcriptional regulator [Vibrio hippocampi]CAH0529457.1 Mannitol operon repressor [Vibrio hippocampi]
MNNKIDSVARINQAIHLPNEAELLEVISQAASAAAVFRAAYHALNDAVGSLMQRQFKQKDCSVQFVVDPLMHSSGPLGDMKIRSKLLLGLGVINKEAYEDIEVFVELKEWNESINEDYDFTHPKVLTALRGIKAIKRSMPIEYDPSMMQGLSESMLQMFVRRHNQKVQSTIVLAITDLVGQLSV